MCCFEVWKHLQSVPQNKVPLSSVTTPKARWFDSWMVGWFDGLIGMFWWKRIYTAYFLYFFWIHSFMNNLRIHKATLSRQEVKDAWAELQTTGSTEGVAKTAVLKLG